MQTTDNRENKIKSSFPIILLLLGTICFFANNHILTVAIPLLINDMGYSLSIIGYCTAAMGAITILMKFITPTIINNTKVKVLLVMDFIFLASITLGFTIFESASSIIILRSAFGMPFSLFPILNLVIISAIALDRDQLVRYTSIIGMAMPISMMVSPIITELLLAYFSYKLVFFVAFLSAVISLVLYYTGLSFFKNVEQNRDKDKKGRSALPDKEALSRLIMPILAFFFLGIVDMLVLTYYPLMAEDLNKTYSFFFTLFAISMVISQKLYASIQLTANTKLILGYGLLGISTLLSGLCNISFMLFSIAGAIALGIGFSLVETTTNTMMMSEKNSSSLITIQQLSICIGRTLGPWFVSFFSDTINSLKYCFVLLAASQIIPIMLIFISRKKQSLS